MKTSQSLHSVSLVVVCLVLITACVSGGDPSPQKTSFSLTHVYVQDDFVEAHNELMEYVAQHHLTQQPEYISALEGMNRAAKEMDETVVANPEVRAVFHEWEELREQAYQTMQKEGAAAIEPLIEQMEEVYQKVLPEARTFPEFRAAEQNFNEARKELMLAAIHLASEVDEEGARLGINLKRLLKKQP